MRMKILLTFLSFPTVHSFSISSHRYGTVRVRVADVNSGNSSPRPRTLEDDLPQLKMENELSSFVEIESGAKSAQKTRLSAVQDRLAKTIELKDRVENLFVDEIEGIVEKLEEESKAETVRAEDISNLASKFEDALNQKRQAVERDEDLLVSLRSTLGMVREEAIQATMQFAIDDKETLCTIERELIGKMEQCLSQLDEELTESNSRRDQMDQVLSALPAVGDRLAVRSYSWADIAALNEVLVENAESALKREAAIESIKSDFSSAMDRRRRILSGEPALVAAPSAPPSKVPEAPAAAAAAAPTPQQAAQYAASGSRRVRPATNDELTAELGEAATELGASVVGVTEQVIGSIAVFLSSPEAQATVMSSSAAFKSAVGAAKTAATTWDDAVQETVSTNVRVGPPSDGQPASESGEWWVTTAFNKVKASKEVQESLAIASEEAQSALESLGKAGKNILEAPTGTDIVLDENPLESLAKSTARLGKAISAVVGRIAGNDDFSLPPGR